MMTRTLLDWDGEHLPDGLRLLPPGRYEVVLIDELSADEDAGIVEALQELEGGKGVPLATAIAELMRT